MPCVCKIMLGLAGLVVSGVVLYAYYRFLRFLRREENDCPCLLILTLAHPLLTFIIIPHDTLGLAMASTIVPATLYAIVALMTWYKIWRPHSRTIPARPGYCGEPERPAETVTTRTTGVDWVQAVLTTIGFGVFLYLTLNIELIIPM